MESKQPLLPDIFYHVYNRGNGAGNIFFEEENYTYFLSLWNRHVEPVAETYAYCLMKNHFHFLIRIRDEETIKDRMWQNPNSLSVSEFCSKQLSNCFNAFTKAMNKRYHLTGSLFQKRFERKRVENKAYLLTLISYIHQNPQKHGFVEDFRDYPYSSYKSHLSEKQTRLKRMSVFELFGGKEGFIQIQNQEISVDDKFADMVVERII